MATIRKRVWVSGGQEKTAWVADYFDQNGKRHLKTLPRKKDAKDWLTKAQGEVQRGVHTPENTSITVAEAGALWLRKGELEKLERSTLREYRRSLSRYIGPKLGTIKLARLSAPMIEDFRDDLLGTCSRAMARKILASLKSLLGEVQRRGLVAQNAAALVKISTNRRENGKLAVGVDIPSKAEINTIIAKVEGRWRPLFVTAIFSGMRASELRGLTWDAVDLDKKVIHVRQRADRWGVIGSPKSAAGSRTIPLSPMVVNVLREWRLACPKGPLDLVFPNGSGRVEDHANIAGRGFYRLQQEAGIVGEDGKPKYGVHCLRHFCASWLIEQGFSPKKVQDMLGHSSIKMTYDRYGHLFPSLEDDHAKLAAGELALVGGRR